MFRRRRRNRGRWFPSAVPAIDWAQLSFAQGAASESIDASPFIADSLDIPANIGTAGLTLSSAVGPGSSYLIKRIVGDVDASLFQLANNDSHAHIGLSFFVDRVTNDGVLQNLETWQMFNQGGGSFAGWGNSASQKRWLFRRVWHLGNTASTVANRDPVFPPYSASWYGGGVAAGTHIDIKVKARVTVQERLFVGWHLIGGSFSVAGGTNSKVAVRLNARMFAVPTTADNR